MTTVSRAGFFALSVLVLLIGFAIGFLIGHIGIKKPCRGGCFTNGALSQDGDPEITEKLFQEINPENIRGYLKKITATPHLAGTPADLKGAEYLKGFWDEAGFDHTKIIPFNVLLSYPDKENPNKILLYNKDTDEILHTTQLKEKILHPDEDNNDVVPPFTAYSAPGNPRGELVYVNYGRIEDFKHLTEDLGVDVSGKIAIARYGKIFRGDKAKFAERFGAIGLILYSDPQEEVSKSELIPEIEPLPPSGVQRGNIQMRKGDPETPGYPSTDTAYRVPLDKTGLPNITVHPIGYGDAYEFLSKMGGADAPSEWQGDLNITYKLGPGFINPSLEVQMKISTNYKRVTVNDVFGYITGAVEPDRYVLMGNHRDAWVFGAVDPSSGTAVMMELTRAMGKLLKEGWRPRRTIIFCSWAAEEYGLVGSREWVELTEKMLGSRAVAYLNLDTAVRGRYFFDGRALPMLKKLMFQVTKKVPDPTEENKSVYETWAQKRPDGQGQPVVPILGSGSDFNPFIETVGVTSSHTVYRQDTSKFSSKPYYHTLYETFRYVNNTLDPTFKFHATMAKIWGEMGRRLAEDVVLTFDVFDYAKAIRGYLPKDDDLDLMKNHGMEEELGFLESAVEEFENSASKFMKSLDDIDKNNPFEVRRVNDQMMQLERVFIDPFGLPGRPLKRHVIFAPSAHDIYSGSGFPGLNDLLYEAKELSGSEADKKWEELRRYLTILTHFLDVAAKSLGSIEDMEVKV